VLLLGPAAIPRSPATRRPTHLPDHYDVPAFHSLASENEALAWNFFVQHHEDPVRDRRDPKFRRRSTDATWWVSSVGRGAAAAPPTNRIWVYPHNADWDGLAAATGDASWSAASMRGYFERIENCRHRPLYRWLARLGVNPTRHGWAGWLPVEHAVPREALTDRRLRRVVIEAARGAMRATPRLRDRLRWFARGLFDPNDWRLVRDDAIGIRYLPLTSDRRHRTGTRERLLDVARRHPGRLTIGLDTLVTRVLFDDTQRAIGVEYARGARLYRAHVRPAAAPGAPGVVRASREVILCGGTFNTPQLLMLSGIGPPEELRRHGIPVRVALPGVGGNLQDRYEVSVVSEMDFPAWDLYRGAEFRAGDAAYTRWTSGRGGLYGTNGAVLTVFTKSTVPMCCRSWSAWRSWRDSTATSRGTRRGWASTATSSPGWC
jgi:choline dehydrogenase-like flavoprotein